jgi:pimeloyl-ACP methyl ester carboxylesterase
VANERRLVEESAVLLDGPWTHRDINANGIRMHIAEAGTGPLVVLLHGFPEFWWSWHHQLVALADAGCRAVAVDLRGYGASDKPPRGYDVFTLSDDLAGLIRSLGESSAIVVGHDWGAALASVLATRRPEIVRGLVMLGMAHPLAYRRALLRNSGGQRRISRYFLQFQVPRRPERRLTMDDGAYVAELTRSWGNPSFPDPATEELLRTAIQIPGVAHCSMEYYRWAFRSAFRSDGRRMVRTMSRPVRVPTLQLHGARDACVLPSTARGTAWHVAAPYEWQLLEGAGHFLHEEVPDVVNAHLLRWIRGLE